MLACLPFAWLWLQPKDMREFAQSLVAVATYSSNVYFWQTSGYFERASEFKPLLHTWSLAVEEQYYLLFPICLILIRRWRPAWVLAASVVVALLSSAGPR